MEIGYTPVDTTPSNNTSTPNINININSQPITNYVVDFDKLFSNLTIVKCESNLRSDQLQMIHQQEDDVILTTRHVQSHILTKHISEYPQITIGGQLYTVVNIPIDPLFDVTGFYDVTDIMGHPLMYQITCGGINYSGIDPNDQSITFNSEFAEVPETDGHLIRLKRNNLIPHLCALYAYIILHVYIPVRNGDNPVFGIGIGDNNSNEFINNFINNSRLIMVAFNAFRMSDRMVNAVRDSAICIKEFRWQNGHVGVI